MTVSALNPQNLDVSPGILSNLQILAASLTILEKYYGKPFIVNRGLSSIFEQAQIDPAHMNDAHVKGCGVDLADWNHILYNWCFNNQDKLVNARLWLESSVSAKNHVHLQSYAPASGNRVFIA